MEWIGFRAMNTDVLVAAQGPLAKDGMQAARTAFEAGERRFSRFQQESELSLLNLRRVNGSMHRKR